MAALSAATFGSAGTFGSALLRSGWSPGGVVLARIVVAGLVLTPAAVVQLRGRWGRLRRSRRGRRPGDDGWGDRGRRDQRHRLDVGMLNAVCVAAYFFPAGTPTTAGGSATKAVQPLSPVVLSWAGMCAGAVFLLALGLAHAVPLAAGTGDVALAGHRTSWVVPVIWAALGQVPSGVQFADAVFIIAGVALVRADESQPS